MTLQEFTKWIRFKVFKTAASGIYMNLSQPRENGQGIMQTKDAKGHRNSCAYYLEEEYGELFISYMDKEYIIRMLPDGNGFEFFGEGTVHQVYYIIHQLDIFSGN